MSRHKSRIAQVGDVVRIACRIYKSLVGQKAIVIRCGTGEPQYNDWIRIQFMQADHSMGEIWVPRSHVEIL